MNKDKLKYLDEVSVKIDALCREKEGWKRRERMLDCPGEKVQEDLTYCTLGSLIPKEKVKNIEIERKLIREIIIGLDEECKRLKKEFKEI
jgi:hypothetical protein